MSYILEALKKAQAERQLGSAPTIHATPLARPQPAAAGARRKPLLIGLGGGVLVAALAAAVAWRQPDRTPAPAKVPVAAATAEPVAAAPASASVPAPAAAALAEAPQALPQEAPARPVRRAAAAARAPGPAAAVSRAAVPESHAQGAAAVPPETVPDNVPSLLELPESIQRELPKVVFGGYIYSKNPSDRLLLVDKMLRREGEQVAPGLVLEKLLPKAAVMNYKGYRYRVTY